MQLPMAYLDPRAELKGVSAWAGIAFDGAVFAQIVSKSEARSDFVLHG